MLVVYVSTGHRGTAEVNVGIAIFSLLVVIGVPSGNMKGERESELGTTVMLDPHTAMVNNCVTPKVYANPASHTPPVGTFLHSSENVIT